VMQILMGTFCSLIKIMDGWSHIMKRCMNASKRINVHIGHTPHHHRQMHSIILVEEMNLRSDGHLDVIAILENESRHKMGTYIYTPPDYAPIRASTIISAEALPIGVTFAGKSREELGKMMDRHQLFLNQQWKVVGSGDTKPKADDLPGGRLFF